MAEQHPLMLTPILRRRFKIKMDFRIKVFAQTQSFVLKFVTGNVNTYELLCWGEDLSKVC